MRANNIGSDSRKLVTNNTLVGATDAFTKLLVQLEKQGQKTGAYDDLLDFFVKFFDEYSHHFKAVLPKASKEERQKLRTDSFAISNILFHPLFRIAKDLWLGYKAQQKDWKTATEWKDVIAKIAGKTTPTDPDGNPILDGDGKPLVVGVMDRTNPDWVGKILIVQYGPKGPTGTSLSNTRQTREAAYNYLADKAGASKLIAAGVAASAPNKKGQP